MARASGPPGAPRRAGWASAWEGTLEAGLSVAIAVGIGYFIDTRLGTEPLVMFAGLVLGGIAAVRRLLRIGAAALADSATQDAGARPKAPPRSSVPAGPGDDASTGETTSSPLGDPADRGRG